MKTLMISQRHNVFTALETGLISVRSFTEGMLSFVRLDSMYNWAINSKPECRLSALIGKLNRIMSGGLYFHHSRCKTAFSPGT